MKYGSCGNFFILAGYVALDLNQVEPGFITFLTVFHLQGVNASSKAIIEKGNDVVLVTPAGPPNPFNVMSEDGLREYENAVTGALMCLLLAFMAGK